MGEEEAVDIAANDRARIGQGDGMARQRGKIKGATGQGERMPGAHHQRQRLGIEVLEGQPDHVGGIDEAGDHQIEVAVAQLVQHLRVGAGGHAHDRFQRRTLET